MSRSPTSGQTILEDTLKSPAGPSGPGWWRGRGQKNNPPTDLFTLSDMLIFLNSIFTQQTSSFSVTVSLWCAEIPSQRSTNRFCEFYTELLKVDHVQHFLCNIKCCIFWFSPCCVRRLWRQTQKLEGTWWDIPFWGYLSWQMSGEMLGADGNTAVTHFQFRKRVSLRAERLGVQCVESLNFMHLEGNLLHICNMKE